MSSAEDNIGAAALRARLRNVYWIGGGSGAGKSVIARRIAARHGLRSAYADDVLAIYGDLAGGAHERSGRAAAVGPG
jgi:predicted kinase